MILNPKDVLTEEEYLHQTNSFDTTIKDGQSAEEDPTYSTFCSSLQKKDNLYSADLPWRSGLSLTSNNYYLAKKRLNSIIISLNKTGNYDLIPLPMGPPGIAIAS